MKNNIIYSFSILIIEIGLLLQWFTLRRITMIMFYLLFALSTSMIICLIPNIIIIAIVGFINGWYIAKFILWNFKKEDHEFNT